MRRQLGKWIGGFFASCMVILLVGCTLPKQIALPQIETIRSVTISDRQISRSLMDRESIEEIRDILQENASPTFRESVSDTPVNVESYITITFQEESSAVTGYLYMENNRYYFEIPYQGIWRLSLEEYEEILDYLLERDSIDDEE